MDSVLLWEERQISQLVTRYANALDDRDWEGFSALFAEQIELDTSGLRGDPPSMIDRDAWVARARATVDTFYRVLHYSSNHAIEVSGDRATCRSHAYNVHEYLHGDQSRRFVVYGRYTHGFVRVGDRWLIDGLKLTFVMREGEPPARPS